MLTRAAGNRVHKETENSTAIMEKSYKQTRSRTALGYIENKVTNDTNHAGKPQIIKQDVKVTRPKTAHVTNNQEVTKVQMKPEFAHPKPVAAVPAMKPIVKTNSKINSKPLQTCSSKDVKTETSHIMNHVVDQPLVSDQSSTMSQMDITIMDLYDLKPTIKDIDAGDAGLPHQVSEYVNEIYAYMMFLEAKHNIRPNFLNKEGQETTPKMRAILVNWLSQVHCRFRLLQETMFLTVAIVDRYLQDTIVSKSNLQLVGVAAMLIASKYEEMYMTEISDYVYITDNAYTKADIRLMERRILNQLEFSFGRPLCLHFLRRDSKAGEVDAKHHMMAKYLMELMMTCYELAHQPPSIIAAAALAISLHLDNLPWTDTLTHYSRYSLDRLKPIIKLMAGVVLKSSKSTLNSVKSKYQSAKYMNISVVLDQKSNIIRKLAS